MPSRPHQYRNFRSARLRRGEHVEGALIERIHRFNRTIDCPLLLIEALQERLARLEARHADVLGGAQALDAKGRAVLLEWSPEHQLEIDSEAGKTEGER